MGKQRNISILRFHYSFKYSYFLSMKNWSGHLSWNPYEICYPKSEEEVQAIILKAASEGRKVRTIGTGHSFTQLSVTDDYLVSLDEYQGLSMVDQLNYQASIKGGTKLALLGELLYAEGMAMENLGDIDVQSIAGTISTGTHGTGIEFGTISTQVIALKFINGLGEIIQCSVDQNFELFKAAQVSLGAFGIITEVTLQCVPAYKLALQNKKVPLAEVLGNYKQLNKENRNFEFYWFPYTKDTWTKTSNVVKGQANKVGLINYYSEFIAENLVFQVFCEMANLIPSLNKSISKISAAAISNSTKIYDSHKVYATTRWVRFNEMEYNVPLEAYDDVIKDVVNCLNSKKFPIHFPIENRFVKGDDILLSPAYGRDSAYIAIHAYHKKDQGPYFKALEEIFRAYDGRPHWGKMNNLNSSDFASIYPAFEKFAMFRQRQDPNGLFLSPYLKTILS